ncbi:hypothetical protein L211DRAFT_838167 [Terfezia boudieri ATCC MYA-4762]|uniref:LYC1 C-terminal domain-containing protein n=1 Tax=Terfezia boudieri ATCC MYA-4762 TaxID=1051890 RepID=A0A3N4LR54_9PEZI|nr:hypothetical protein L211DRAFT_838167 [Terfezia boudieri ATCC MYA-4762]
MTGDSHYILREATPDELEQTRRGHFSSWAGGLSVEQYIGREIHIANNVSAEHGGVKCWILTSSVEPCRVLCSCETMGKPAFVLSVKDGKEQAREVTSYIIGSVFTPEQNRRNGYASIMLDLLARRLAMECEFDALYSDLGKKFYADKGWKPHPSNHISLPPAASIVKPSGVKLLEDRDLPLLCNRDVDSIQSRYHETRLQPNVDACIVYLPKYHVIRWHHSREEYLSKITSGKIPIIKGAISPSGERWCIWNRNFNTLDPSLKKLWILRMVDMEGDNDMVEEEKVDEIMALLEAAQEQAWLWGMTEVLLWSPSKRVVKAASKILGKQVEVVEREMDSICSLRWNGDKGQDANVIWDLNEKFAWC